MREVSFKTEKCVETHCVLTGQFQFSKVDMFVIIQTSQCINVMQHHMLSHNYLHLNFYISFKN